MGFAGRFVFVITTLMAAVLFKQYRDLTEQLPAPQIKYQEYWGPGDADNYTKNIDILPFELNYGEKVIDILKNKLNDVPNLAEPLEGVAFQYGFNSRRLREVIEYWRTEYLSRWDERQNYLNQYPQFKTQIQGLEIHFLHVKPKNVRNPKRILPIIMLHGWPGSVREFYEIIPQLTTRSDEKEYVFEVIVPSLPGYGFSQGAAKQGLSPAKIAVILRNLMIRLGFKKYYVHGGDWGAIVGNLMATFFQNEVLGVHLTMCTNSAPIATVKNIVGSLVPSFVVDEKYTSFYYPLTDKLKKLLTETGYMHIQATKPDTIGAALTGNPVGLAAYILEKFSTWTNPAYRDLPDGGLVKYFSLDALLDNVMIYYLTDSITTSQRLYSEAFNSVELSKDYDRIPTRVPAACAKFRHDLMHQTDWALRDHFRNMIQSNHFDDGGHFAALQLPEVLYKDIVQFVNRLYRREDQY
ncbi:juvenile hormone epoxide hydrolase 1-like [Topomyia yanbarensis]|uniref:juvenile hormone epoxide hydrolase 1-like n=1 Tax=Topomyia yanbarensis TaxID=2498891 RepID=UPI00273C1C97|nr:juvenile hormone epoxide hydrolase 1-like [Topomyia yanbarensis]